MPELPFAQVAPLLLAWYGKAGRDLPWRNTRDPYRVWLSEIMLQQTGVAAVIPYFEKFLARFPDLEALATAPVEEVIELWAGLGYYSRARNLHATAREVVAGYAGSFPQTLEALTALPGIGRSTAGAILSIAFDVPAPILDGNVRRVLCRLFAWQEDPRSSAAERQLWRWAEALTPLDRPHDYAQAIMDLGATLCTPTAPACERCPLENLCQGRALGIAAELPRRQNRQKVPTRIQVALLLDCDGSFLVRRRPLAGMLAGLWEFPGTAVAAGETPEVAAGRLLRELGGEGRLRFAGGIEHAYSHFRLDLHLFRADAPAALQVAEAAESRWLTRAELAGFPLHGAHKKALVLL
ncbi:A/G-specific adenine glycosylase [Desulfuromonas carbonis]|uniref:A/G-specific adenine glycosylase n=1 Tax=Desulfuromonas sp. DDH964 TaxID=1823759 RepID=UPI00078C3789|nr:A/G-specific adenine glycosylase [Desulfuromonas sp. DDH964]AMV70917.1 endonuclease III family protein [Desulfuromonas sp. DDH964]